MRAMKRLEEEISCKEILTDLKCKNVGEYDDFKAIYINNELVSSIPGNIRYDKGDIMTLLVAVYNKLDKVQDICEGIQERMGELEYRMKNVEDKIKQLEIDVECAPGGEVERQTKEDFIFNASQIVSRPKVEKVIKSNRNGL